MAENFFLGFVAHAHTRNDLIADPNLSLKQRGVNNIEESQRLTELSLGKIEKDLFEAGFDLKDVKLILLYLSYRGDTEEKDRHICEKVLETIDKRFNGKVGEAGSIRLIGHTTAGEIENDDLELKEVTGIGYNGLSILALATNLPIGIGRTRGLRTGREAVEQGREMAHSAWVDMNQCAESKEQLQRSKTLFVLTKGARIGKFGYEYFLADGIADFISSAREARITNVLGGCSGDGIIGRNMRQFYGKIGGHSEIRILDEDAVCAMIPLLDELSLGLDLSPVRKIGETHIFHFDPDVEPKYKFLKRIDDEDPRIVHARAIFENESQICLKQGSPLPSESEFFEQISEIDGIPLNLILAKYAFAFPFGNYSPMSLLKVNGDTMELLQPIRSHDPSLPGHIVVIDHEKVQKGACNVFNMLQESRGFLSKDTTFIISCISRRLAEMISGSQVNTECQIFKEGFSSTQVFGFLAYGEMFFTNMLQEPYVYTCSCWGMTLHSKLVGKDQKQPIEVEMPVKLTDSDVKKPSFEFTTDAAESAFSYTLDAFVKDYMHEKMALEKSGWRSLMDVVKYGKVPKSSIYNAQGGIGNAITELERRGLVEIRVFPGERGRGGRVLKLRLAYEKEIIKRHVDLYVMKNKEK
ncbi:MAG: hypothetical protein LUP94_01990 [Candidatus Methanomethylicus sp.]|nr:hypothetical protein [Candidatus Methanomethylicus sp.]